MLLKEISCVVLEYILNPKFKFFTANRRSKECRCRIPGIAAARQEGPGLLQADFKDMESSFKGHTVDALVPTGDEGRDKLR